MKIGKVIRRWQSEPIESIREPDQLSEDYAESEEPAETITRVTVPEGAEGSAQGATPS